MKGSSKRFLALDSWRGVCALLVAAFHFPAASVIADAPVIARGMLFVDFFFVLSGFVIAANYIDRLGGAAPIGRFMWLRVGRLWPLHIAVFLAYFAFESAKALAAWRATGAFGDAFTGDKTLESAVSNVFLVHSLGLHHDLTWNRPSWSISCELFAYAAFAGLTLFGARLRFAAYAVATAACCAALYVLNERNFIAMHDFGFFRCLAGFLSGVFVWRAWTAADAALGEGGGPARAGAATLVELGAVALVIWFTAAFSISISFLTPLVFSAVVFVFAFEGGVLSRLMKRPFLVLLGTLSYSIYMVHQFIIDRMINFAGVLDARLGAGLLAQSEKGYVQFQLTSAPFGAEALTLVFLGGVVAVSWVTYRLVEAPSRDWFRAALGRRAQQPKRVPAAW